MRLAVLLTSIAVLCYSSRGDAQTIVRSRTACFAAPVVQTAYVAQATVAYNTVPYVAAQQVYTQPYIFSALNESVVADAAAFRAYSLLLQQQALGVSRQQQVSPQEAGPPPIAQPRIKSNPPPTAVNTGVDKKLQDVVTKSCVQCHSTTAKKGGLDLTDLASVSVFDRMHALVKVNRGEMPPKPTEPLPDDQVLLFDQWLRTAEIATAKK